MSYGMTCPKCGLMQLAAPTCKSCGAHLGGEATVPTSRPAKAQKTDASAPPPPGSARTEATSSGSNEDQIHRLVFHGTGGSLFGISIVNTFLTIITLGIYYYFWGKVRVRSYLLSQAEFDGDRFAYHGTGKELLLGTLKAAVLFFLPIFGLRFLAGLPGVPPAVRIVAGFLASSAILIVIPLAMVGARRYRLSRTSWRGIRFSFRGRAWEFVRLFIRGSLLSGLTLGLYYPFFDTRRHAFFVSHSYFGSQKCEFDGEGKQLFGSFLLALVLLPFTLGVSWLWYLAKKQRYFWEHTLFEGAAFRYPVTGGKLLRLYLGNLLLLLVTLGLAWSWVTVRTIRFSFRYLTLEGPLDLTAIQQEAQ
ncbi:MAG TPA: DUF898 family protein, partial [Candidatus Acidoferrum sp.]|nr:DUF898 family protein [Candidatus Acidoferrum sp.]